jgi:predicted ArsR family transcriptional regulator
MADAEPDAAADALAAVSTLAEPTRRALYEYVVAHGAWVGRDQAAAAVGLERGTAAHHLDRLVADGLLTVDYQRLTGRRGPGAGRPAKLYRRAPRDFGVSLPPRDYELAARMLADACARSQDDGSTITRALGQVADAEGVRLAEEIRGELDAARAKRVPARRKALLEALARRGFEPQRVDDGTVVLRNCPFHHLAQEHTALICGMNLCLLRSVVERVGDTGLTAHLEPEEGLCCVRFSPDP